MEVKLAEKLKQLRRERGNTQEELANHLNISVQAVSKWERGDGLPDISILPSIALFYNVSLDKLFGIDEIAVEVKFAEYERRDSELILDANTPARLELWREAAREFPNNHKVLLRLFYRFNRFDKKEFEERRKLGQRLLAESTDIELRQQVIRILCFDCVDTGDLETAKHFAEMAPGFITCRELLYNCCLTGGECVEYNQEVIRKFMDNIYDCVRLMNNVGDLTENEKIKTLEYSEKLFDILYEDGDYGFAEQYIASIYMRLAVCWCKLGDSEKAILYIEKAPEHMIKFNALDNVTPFKHTSPVVNRLTRLKLGPRDLMSGYIDEYENNPDYELIRGDARFTAALNKLKENKR